MCNIFSNICRETYQKWFIANWFCTFNG